MADRVKQSKKKKKKKKSARFDSTESYVKENKQNSKTQKKKCSGGKDGYFVTKFGISLLTTSEKSYLTDSETA